MRNSTVFAEFLAAAPADTAAQTALLADMQDICSELGVTEASHGPDYLDFAVVTLKRRLGGSWEPLGRYADSLVVQAQRFTDAKGAPRSLSSILRDTHTKI